MKTGSIAKNSLSAALLSTAIIGFTLCGTASAADNSDCASCALSNASVQASQAIGTIGQGSLTMVKGSAQFVVASVTTVGEGSVVVLKGASEGVTASVHVSAEVAHQLSNAVGASVTVVATSTGNMLVMSGKAIAFVPNEIGLALLHQSKLD